MTQRLPFPSAIRSSPDAGATFSLDLIHRYKLFRRIGKGDRSVLFIMLNPSTADAANDDATIRRCIGFTRTWGYDRLDVVNLFSLRSTDPRALYEDPMSASGDPANMTAIEEAARLASLVVCAWGIHGALWGRGEHVRQHLERSEACRRPLLDRSGSASIGPRHLGLTKDGHPKHPLRLRADTKPEWWRDERGRGLRATDGHLPPIGTELPPSVEPPADADDE